MITQVKIKNKIPNFFRKIFGLFLLLISLFLYSQSFTDNNPDVYIDKASLLCVDEQPYSLEATHEAVIHEPYLQEKGEVYIGNAVVSRTGDLQNCKVYHTRSQKKKNYFQKTKKTHRDFKNISRSARNSQIIRIQGIVNLSHRRASCSAFVVTGPVSHVNKSKIYKESPCVSQMIFIYKDSVIFPYYSTPTVSGLKFFAYSRPPPQSY